ncbi:MULTISPECIES: glycosyltransferase [unclassified Alteromonas]|uniref:glycosyltransferase n=1 Tax=unclassified Alteromonas TaxID=2614992 RepID=UPI000509E65C|nr:MULTISPECIES: glycosyltransferase [unclassified Alteromonas]
MIIVHIFSALHQGGAENQFEQIVADNANSECTHLVVSMKKERSKLSDRLEKKGLPVYFFDFTGVSFIHALIELRRLLKSLMEEDKVVIQCWMYHANAAGWILSLLTSVPLIWSIRRTEIPKGVTGALARISAIMGHFGSFPIVSNSHAGKESHQRIFYPSRIRVIGNGFSIDKLSSERPSKLDSFNFVHIGRYAPIKGQQNFAISAIKLLEKLSEDERKCITFTFIGRDVEAALSKTITATDFKNHFNFLGEVESPRRTLYKYSCYVLSSLSEGSPNSLVEAMLEALPCIASDVGDARRILNNDAMLYKPNDSDRLADLMEAMLKTPSPKLVEMGEANRKRAMEWFGVERVRAEYEKLYEEVAK